jgi:zinc finger CCHC domain-containing protein 9
MIATMKPPAQRNKTKGKLKVKVKLTKEERRTKYTEIARKQKQTRRQLHPPGSGRRPHVNNNSYTHNANNDIRKSVCYSCRQPGHNAINCPLIQKNNHIDKGSSHHSKSKNTVSRLVCYKCGSTEHSLSLCPKRQRHSTNRNNPQNNDNDSNITNDHNDDDLPFATCFICNQMGHLASQCPQNSKGIYVNGGCCRVCGSLRHLATHCPENTSNNKKRPKPNDGIDGTNDVEVEDLLEQDASSATSAKDLRLLVEKKTSTTTATSTSTIHKVKRRVVTF